MSVLIKDIEKPKSCYAVIDGESEYCPFVNTDDDCVLQLKKGICEGTWEEQYSKCPLVETPEPCEDAVSRNAIIQKLNTMDRYVSEELILCDTDKKFPKNEVFIVDDVYEEIVENLPSAQPETAKRIVGKSRNGMTLWYQCDMCNESVDAQDNFCRGCGRRLTDG